MTSGSGLQAPGSGLNCARPESKADTSKPGARKPEPGFTLIELTVVLAVIVTLALVLTPSIANFITDSRVVRSRTDTQTLAASITTFYRDNGFFPQWSTAGAGGSGLATDRVDLLVSGGNTPTSAGAPTATWTSGTTDRLEDQLISNAPAYAVRTATSTFGWNGPYLSSAITADAWNNRYSVNIGLIDTTQGVQTGAGAIKSAVWVVSAGSNGAIETVYSQALTLAVSGGDDIAMRLQ